MCVCVCVTVHERRETALWDAVRGRETHTFARNLATYTQSHESTHTLQCKKLGGKEKGTEV